MFDITKYKFYNTGNKVIAVSTYAGKTVRGCALCAPEDSYNEEKGRQLAAARCNVKVAARRARRAEKKMEEAYEQQVAAERYMDKMVSYKADSDRALTEAVDQLNDILATM